MDGSTAQLNPGDPVYQDDVIETAGAGAVGLRFNDDTTFAVGSGARLVLDDFVYDPSANTGNAVVSVLQGSFSFVSGAVAQTGDDALTVRTPVLTIGVRGTYVTGQGGQEGETTEVVNLPDDQGNVGSIWASNSAGGVLLDQANEGTQTNSQFQAPGTPRIYSPDEINQKFSNALDFLPPTPDVRRGEGQQDVDSQRRDGNSDSNDGDGGGDADSEGEEGAEDEAEGEGEDGEGEGEGEGEEDGSADADGEGESGDGEGEQAAAEATPPPASRPPATKPAGDSFGDALNDLVDQAGNPGGGGEDAGAPPPPPPPPPPDDEEVVVEENNNVATDGNDTLAGTEGDDTIDALGGDDNVESQGGNDAVQGGTGNDNIRGGAGNDTLNGNDGDDALDGEDGDDVLNGETGNDTLTGGAGADTLDGGVGTDTADFSGTIAGSNINLAEGSATDGTGDVDAITGVENILGSAFDDTITGDANANSLSGGGGNDTLIGGDGNDTLLAGAGNDTLDGGDGGDSMEGGAGNDLYLIEVIGDRLISEETSLLDVPEFGGTAVQSAQLDDDIFLEGTFLSIGVSGAGSFGTANAAPAGFNPGFGETQLGMSVDQDGFGIGDAPNTTDFFLPGSPEEGFTVGYIRAASQFNFTNAERSGEVELTQQNVVNQSSGSTLQALWEGVTNGDGNRLEVDQVVTFDEDGKFFQTTITLTNVGDVTLDSVRYMRSFDPDQESNGIPGGAGAVTLNEVINQPGDGGGDNLAIVSATGVNLGVPFFFLADDARARVATNSFFNRDVFEAVLHDSPQAEGTQVQADEAIVINFDVGSLTAGQSATLTFFSSLDQNFEESVSAITGGDDTIVEAANGGDDTVQSGIGFALPDNVENLELVGSDNIDGVGNADANSITGNIGNNVLQGAGGNDTLDGGFGLDTLQGGDGDDRLIGGNNNDSISGGAGTDTAVFTSASTDFTITDDGTSLILTDTVGGDGTDTVNSDVENLEFSDFTLALQLGTAGADVITGTGGLDRLLGLGGNDTITGLGSLDALFGGADNDQLDGGASSDTLFGGAGTDVLLGNTGNDVLSGDDGDDSLTGGDGNDLIQGGAGTDRAIYAGVSDNFEVVDIGAQAILRDTVGAEGEDTIGSDVEEIQFADITVTVQVGTAGVDTLTGDANQNALFGLAGNDQLNGAGGNDIIFGGADNDVLAGGDGDDTLQGGDGNDSLSGDVGDDSLSGGTGTDTVTYADSSENFDAVFAGDGSQLLLTDTVGIEGDTLLGNGADAIDNTVEVVAFSDETFALVFGTAGADNLTGGETADAIGGGDGNDTIAGSTGDDFIDGGSGTDSVDGGVGNDELIGGDGNDTLTGGAGNDEIDGGAGTDRAVYAGASTNFTISDQGGNVVLTDNTGAEGTDTLIGIEEVQFSDVTIVVTPGTDGADNLTGDANDNSLFGLGGNDTISGLAGRDLLAGGTGNDIIDGGDGFDSIFGGDGDDTLRPGTNDSDGDVIGTGNGNDVVEFLSPGAGFFVLDYSDQTAAINGNIGNTTGTVTKGNGTDSLTGILDIDGINGGLQITGTDFNDALTADLANGDEFIQFRGGAGNDTFTGGNGFDRLDYVGAAAGVSVDIGAGTTSNDGDGGIDSFSNIDEVRGSDNADSLLGSAGNDRFITREGNDTVDGAGGFDLLRYDRATVETVNLDATAGTATVNQNGSVFTDTFSNIESFRGSRTGNDTLSGSAADEQIDGRGGNDIINGGAGQDTLIGGDGDDTIDPGQNTTFDFIETRTGSDTVNFSDPGQGFFVLAYGDQTAGINANIGNTSGTIAKATGTDTLQNVDLIDGSGLGGLQITGSGFDDTLTADLIDQNEFIQFRGRGGNDSFTGGGGFDRLDYVEATSGITIDVGAGSTGVGLDGDGGTDTFSNIDEVRGSDFADSLLGSVGDDRFITRLGNDTVNGLGGFDLLRYDRSNVDVVNLDASEGIANVTYTGEVLTQDFFLNMERFRGSLLGDDTLRGAGVDERFEGRGGNDLIEGNGGNDTLQGEDGNDTLTGGAGNDLMEGGAGTDRAVYTGNSENFSAVFADDGSGVVLTDDLNIEGTDTLSSSIEEIEFADGTLLAQYGTAGADNLTGTAAEDVLAGAGGNDTLSGDAGGDVLVGGGGDDLIQGGAGTDEAAYQGPSSNFQATFADDGSNVVLADTVGAEGTDTIANDVEEISFGDETVAVQFGTVGNETLNGGATADALGGADGDDTLFGNDGDDFLVGGNGNDLVVGGNNDDQMFGGDGFDTLTGGIGVDVMSGGAGADQFFMGNANEGTAIAANQTVAAAGVGVDLVEDFQSGVDTFEFAEGDFGVEVGFATIGEAYDGTNSGVGDGETFIFDGTHLIHDADVNVAGYTVIAEVRGDAVAASDVNVQNLQF
ncbi:MAG: FecR domain-containing protein [Minwuia sp.]|uniref:FecR domain-containing protein n=1 Tax=Minwuia sp. TaxID=2493630 RepID=UPI003A83B2AF